MNTEKNRTQSSLARFFLKHRSLILAHLIFWPLAVGGTALDLWSKRAVFGWLEQHNGSVSIIDGFLHLVMAVNNGAAFGLFAGHPNWLIAVSVIALIAIFAVFLFGGNRQRLVQVALGFFAAGVCGNLYDRIFNDGMVRDFIDVTIWSGKHWPAFNVADTMLCFAVGLGIISCFQDPKRS
ncbi:MAG: signal peptidase II [Sedimentisphaerales bacterium]|nr:signal peptidase II [Sedimentisphaerales bacterium]